MSPSVHHRLDRTPSCIKGASTPTFSLEQALHRAGSRRKPSRSMQRRGRIARRRTATPERAAGTGRASNDNDMVRIDASEGTRSNRKAGNRRHRAREWCWPIALHRLPIRTRPRTVARHLSGRHPQVRADGSRRADPDQERDRRNPDLPPFLPRGRVRLVLDEYWRHQHARLHACTPGRGSGCRSIPCRICR